jgi:hypothetical protein
MKRDATKNLQTASLIEDEQHQQEGAAPQNPFDG